MGTGRSPPPPGPPHLQWVSRCPEERGHRGSGDGVLVDEVHAGLLAGHDDREDVAAEEGEEHRSVADKGAAEDLEDDDQGKDKEAEADVPGVTCVV